MTTFETISLWILITTIVAIVAGPIAAVMVTRWGDNQRDARRRKTEVLSTLMRTRPMRLSFDHVGALNLIQLEFYGIEQIQSAYSHYRAHLNQEYPKEATAQRLFDEDRGDRFIELLYQIAKHLGYGFDKRDLEKLSYGPLGWENDENAVRMLRAMSMDLLTGKQSLNVVMRTPPPLSEKFPPAPTN